jgi:protein O-GlcNAc transferase
MVDMWDAILEHFPNAKLLIRRNYVFKFKNEDRVIMLEHEATYQGHMSRYNQIDIALDTAPYSGTTTTCESLVMGTPVVTLADRKNKTIHQNVSASLLINSGLDHLVVENQEDYYRVIQGLMDEISADPNYKEKIQKKFLEGNVCNREQYMRDYETLIEELHHQKSIT